MPSIVEGEGMSATQIPLSTSDWKGDVPPTELMPDVNTISGASAAIASLSGLIMSNWGISALSLSA